MNMFIAIAYAQTPGAAEAASFVAKFNEVILFPIIILLTGVALLVFMYGSFIFITNANNPTARATGQQHILWGIVGLLVMISAYAILSLAANTLGLGNEVECADDPGAPGCNEIFRFPTNTNPSPGTPNPNVNPSPGTPNPNTNPSPGTPNPNVNPN